MAAGGIANLLFPRGHAPQTSSHSAGSLFILLKYDWLNLELKMNTQPMDTQKMEPNQRLRFLQKDQLALALVARKEC